MTAHYVVQAEMKGQSHALYLARKHLTGPDDLVLLGYLYRDRLLLPGKRAVRRRDLGQGRPRSAAASAWRRSTPMSWVTRLIEKPQTIENNLALVGCYYFRRGDDLMSAIEEQMQRNVQLKNEFFLADAVNIMLERRASSGRARWRVARHRHHRCHPGDQSLPAGEELDVRAARLRRGRCGDPPSGLHPRNGADRELRDRTARLLRRRIAGSPAAGSRTASWSRLHHHETPALRGLAHWRAGDAWRAGLGRSPHPERRR